MSAESIILMSGPPGSGKSTIGSALSRQLEVGHLSTGDHIRSIAAGEVYSFYKDSVNLEISTLSGSGRLPRSLVCAVIEEELSRPESHADVILDGYPRSVEQVAPVFETFSKIGASAVAALYLDVNREEAIERMMGRGERKGERSMDEKFAEDRYDQYVESFRGVLSEFAAEIPVYTLESAPDPMGNIVRAADIVKKHSRKSNSCVDE